MGGEGRGGEGRDDGYTRAVYPEHNQSSDVIGSQVAGSNSKTE